MILHHLTIRFSRCPIFILVSVILLYYSPGPVKADSGSDPPLIHETRYNEFVIDSLVDGTHFLYGQNTGWVMKDGNDAWLYIFAYHDGFQRIKSLILPEDQTEIPGSGIYQYLFEGDQSDLLRHTTCQFGDVEGFFYPQVFFDISIDDHREVMYTYDEFGIGGGGWISPIPLQDPPPQSPDFNMSQPMTIPIPTTGAFHILTNSGNGYEYRRFSFIGEVEIGSVPLLTGVHGTGYEVPCFTSNASGQIVVAAIPGYRVGEDANPDWRDDPTNPLLPALQISRDFGETWSDLIWLDNATVPDLPGTNTGCDNASSGWGYGWLKKVGVAIEYNGIIHLVTTLMDPANNTAPDYFDSIGAEDYGLWYIQGVLEEEEYFWSAFDITMGTGLVPPFPEGSYYGGGSAISNPSLAVTPDGHLICGYTDCAIVYPDSSWSMDYYLVGNTWSYWYWDWSRPISITNDSEISMVYFKSLSRTSDDYVCAYGIPGEYSSNGPLVSYFVPIDDIIRPQRVRGFDTGPTDIHVTDPYPNPVSDDLRVKFFLGSQSNVLISIYDMMGRCVETVHNGDLDAGTYELPWTSKSLPSGSYSIRIRTGQENLSKRVVVIK